MNLPLKADVYCSNRLAGTTSHVVLKPKSDEVSDIVVKLTLGEDSQRIVPIEYLVKSTAHTIELSCGLATLEAMQHFSMVRGSGESVPIFFSSGLYQNAPVIAASAFMVRTGPSEQAPDGEVLIGEHPQGNVIDGHIGHMTALIIDPSTHRISDIILEEGVLWGRKMVEVPMEAIDYFDESAVYLKWDKERLSKLPAMTEEAIGG